MLNITNIKFKDLKQDGEDIEMCFAKMKSHFPSRYYLSDKFPNVYFTLQEARCMFFFLKGYSNKRVGLALNLSPRTIDYYCINMLKKLACNSKQQLIEYTNHSDFPIHLDTIKKSIEKRSVTKEERALLSE